MVTDSLSDLLTQIRNAYLANKVSIAIGWTKARQAVAEVLSSSGYLESATRQDKQLLIVLKYQGKTPAISGLRRISRPGARVYTQIKNLPRVWGGLGINILSTPKGIMPEKQAKKLHMGGELIAQVW